ITIVTPPYAVRLTSLSKLVRIAGALLAIVALVLAGASATRRPRIGLAPRARAVMGRVGLPDLAVAVALLLWRVVSPAFPDDVWLVVRQSMLRHAGGFSSYYSGLGANLPNDYWLEWLQHWAVQATHALVLLRIPVVLVLAGIWVVCRVVLTRALGPAE